MVFRRGQTSFEAHVKTLLASDMVSLKSHYRAFVVAALPALIRQLVQQAAEATSKHSERIGHKGLSWWRSIASS
jgi:hypothetical protein